MARYSQVKDLSVITVAEGKKVGVVDEMRLDPPALKIGWMRVHSGGLFGGDAHWVASDAITGMGQDLITIRSESDLQSLDEGHGASAEGQHGRQIIGNRVVTEDGRLLGEIRDFSFSPSTFAVTELVIKQGNAFSSQQATIPGDRLLTVGSDVIVVTRDAILGVEGNTQPAPDRTMDEETERSQGNPASDSWSPPPVGQPTGQPSARYAESPEEFNHLGSRENQEPDLDKNAPEGGPTIR
jgi:uncharacterized protein YrrD